MTSLQTTNLEGWMQGCEAVRSTFCLHIGGDKPPNFCIIKGIIGLHVGRDGRTDDGSTTQVAKMLGTLFVFVVNVSKCARMA